MGESVNKEFMLFSIKRVVYFIKILAKYTQSLSVGLGISRNSYVLYFMLYPKGCYIIIYMIL